MKNHIRVECINVKQDMASITQEKLDGCQSFLIKLVEDTDLNESCFISFTVYWLKTELEGEIIDLLFRFLRKRECPVVLIAPLIAFVKKQFLELDFESFKKDDSTDEIEKYDPNKVTPALFNLFKTACAYVEKDLSKLKLKDFQQPIHVNIHSVKNKRRKMEDRHVCYEDINTLFDIDNVSHGQSLFAVFDGHGGTEAAFYTSSQLICELKSCPNMITEPGDALKKAVIEVDAKFVEKAKTDKIRSGCTAVMVLIQGINLTVGWLGDSQVVLCKDGQAIQLMEPHKPERDDERQRIESMGGCVMFCGGWRVNGSLGVSRAVGDIDQKPCVTGEPDTEEYEMEGDEEFLILGCDGLWDTVEPIAAVEFVQNCINNGERDQAAEKLSNLAIENGSMDNISIIVVYLDFNAKANLGVS